MGFSLAAALLISACSTSNEETPTSEPESSSNSSEQVVPESSISDSSNPEDTNPEDTPPEDNNPEISHSDIEDSPSSNSTFDLLPGFYPDPAIDTGIVSGTVEASSLTGTDSTPTGACEGFVNESPDHQINLRADFSYLSLEIDSASPVSLVIVGENGDRWCASGSGPRIEEDAWSQGSYDIYVGNPDAPESGDRYELSISEINPNPSNQFGSAPFQEGPPEEGVPGDSFGQGDYQPINVAPGFEPDPAIGTGNVGGPLLATDVTGVADTETGECQGYIDTTADHFLTLEQPFRYLKVQAESPSPTSLVIVGSQEVWCFTGNNPFIEGVWDAGEYEVYLANLDGAAVGERYELLVTELE
ncbi:MAG: hypothetical protein AAGM36_17960 [Cyanobacteria bacterium J06597_1]